MTFHQTLISWSCWGEEVSNGMSEYWSLEVDNGVSHDWANLILKHVLNGIDDPRSQDSSNTAWQSLWHLWIRLHLGCFHLILGLWLEWKVLHLLQRIILIILHITSEWVCIILMLLILGFAIPSLSSDCCKVIWELRSIFKVLRSFLFNYLAWSQTPS